VSTFRARKYKPLPLGLGVAAAVTMVLYFVHVLPAWIPSIVGVLFFLMSPSNATVMAKFLWGGYALYGATSYLGVVLSYIRLMALGMCTGGVAVAINVIAWMLLPVPVVGIIGAVIVLVVGHTYNIAVNVLGAFVHSLRLQYVEFFPRFYSGGGERFVPFRETNQFVSVK
jgi:V/A-type H+-transporting ATPase subunit I